MSGHSVPFCTAVIYHQILPIHFVLFIWFVFSKVWHSALYCHPHSWFLARLVLGAAGRGCWGCWWCPGGEGKWRGNARGPSLCQPVLSPPGSFSKGVAEGEVDPSFGPLEAIRLSIQTDSPVWIILSEVSRAPSAPPHPCPAHRSDPIPLFFQIFIKKAEWNRHEAERTPSWIPGPAPSLPLPPARGASPGPGQRRAGCRGRQSCCCCCASPAGPGRASTPPEEEQKAEPTPLCRAGALLRSLGVLLLLGHTDTGQFGVGMSFSQRGDQKHLQPQTGLKSSAVFGDRAGHTESCQLTPPARWDGGGRARGLPCPLPGSSPGHSWGLSEGKDWPSFSRGGTNPKGLELWLWQGKQKNKICHTVPASIEHSPLTHSEVSSVFMPWDWVQKLSFK